jgi:dTDP-4-dehydrorhamnose reductase
MILVLGGSGYVGSAFRQYLDHEALPYRAPRRAEADYTCFDVLRKLLDELRPEFLINCAGYTGKPNVDACERHKTECLFGNAVFPGLVRQACETAGIPWGHVSTGCIFTGSERAYTETDTPNFTFRQNNCSFYSGTKALGEEILRDAPHCYIWRLRMPFDHVDHPRNYLTKVMRYDRLVEARNSISHLPEACRAATECWRRRVPFGIYHLTNPGAITTREVVELIQKSGRTQKRFQFFTSEAEFMQQGTTAPRSNCVLDTTKLQRTGIPMTEVHEAIALALKNWRPS